MSVEDVQWELSKLLAVMLVFIAVLFCPLAWAFAIWMWRGREFKWYEALAVAVIFTLPDAGMMWLTAHPIHLA